MPSIQDRFSLRGRNYIVTGGGQGINFSITEAICESGGNVAVLDIRTEPVEEFKSLSSQHGVKTYYFQTDVTNEESLNTSFEAAMKELGTLHGFVPGAGIVIDKPFVEQNWNEVNKIFGVNVIGTFFSTQLAVKQFLKQKSPGSVVLIAPLCAKSAAPGHRLSAYHGSKGAVLMLTRALAVEHAPDNIRFNCISPGYTESDMTRNLRKQYPALVETMNQAPPMKRIGTPDDPTPAVIYLLSDASSYTTDTDIEISGGLQCGRIEVNSVK